MTGETETMIGKTMGDFGIRKLNHMIGTGEITLMREAGMMEEG